MDARSVLNISALGRQLVAKATALLMRTVLGIGEGDSPTFSSPKASVALKLANQGTGAFDLLVKNNTTQTADRTATLALGDANRTLTMTGDATVNQDTSTAGNPSVASLTVTATGVTAIKVPATSFALFGTADNNGVAIGKSSGGAFFTFFNGFINNYVPAFSGGWGTTSGGQFRWTNTGDTPPGWDTAIARGSSSNSFIFGDSTAASGAAISLAKINKRVTAIADATTTAVFTGTIPNGNHSASIRVKLAGSAGAGGAVGANESTQDAEYNIDITRTTNKNAVVTMGAVMGQPAAASVAGANNIAVVGSLGAVAGATNASNTFTILVTETMSGGAATNHSCVATASLLNANTSGVTIA